MYAIFRPMLDIEGNELGKMSMIILRRDYPDHTIHGMSDVDCYYEKLSYHWAGSIFDEK
jgi:hypothetical protein